MFNCTETFCPNKDFMLRRPHGVAIRHKNIHVHKTGFVLYLIPDMDTNQSTR